MSQRTALYRLYDADKELLYVGISKDPDTRWAAHEAQQDWWSQVASKTLEWFDDRATALAAEASAIGSELPAHNTIHHPINWPAAKAQQREERERLRELLGSRTPRRTQPIPGDSPRYFVVVPVREGDDMAAMVTGRPDAWILDTHQGQMISASGWS